ncbi:MAG: redox-regulated ATPase YchF [Thermodesulfobacteriota bacterium]|nr:redox-regulated ATPase YchF [Thermodesulfobacteriota bacterium]
MPLSVGLIGLPNVGKSTIFNALTAGGVQTANYPFTTIEPNHGLAITPDPRLERLAELTGQTKIVPAAVEFVDIAGLVKGACRGQGLGNRFLGHIRNVDAIVHVLRCFDDSNVAHHEAVIDPVKDADLIRTELVLADLEILERRTAKVRKPAQTGDKESRRLLTACERFSGQLQKGEPPRAIPGEEDILAEQGLLTGKPLILVANVNEAELQDRARLSAAEDMARAQGVDLVVICGDLEAEIAELDPGEQTEFLASIGQDQPGLDRLIRTAYQTLGLMTFFTIVGSELRAWPVPQGTTASEGAGKIHTDMARGFIAAEVIPFDDLAAAGSAQAARETGLTRIEGRDYVLADGDVVTFRFNV